jgi:hypothetical protein
MTNKSYRDFLFKWDEATERRVILRGCGPFLGSNFKVSELPPPEEIFLSISDCGVWMGKEINEENA